MNYTSLKKLSYFLSKDEFDKEYDKRFNDHDTIKINFYISGHQAFIVQNYEILKLLLNIERADKELTQIVGILPGIAGMQYSKKCLVDEIVLTNKMEGVHSSRREITDTLLELEYKSAGKNRFRSLVNKYWKLYDGETIPLTSCSDIKNIYDEILLEEVALENPENEPDGVIFRKEAASVYSSTGKELHRGLYPEKSIIDSMDKALAFLNDRSVETLYSICGFHYMLEYIHPFYDGNGRLGRFIVSYCLSKELQPILAFRISEMIERNRHEYEEAFLTCNDVRNRGDFTPFIIMMFEIIHKALIELIETFKIKLNEYEKYNSEISELPGADMELMPNFYSLLIQAAMFSDIGISLKELERVSNQSYYKVSKILKQIEENNLLVTKKSGKNKYYSLQLDMI